MSSMENEGRPDPGRSRLQQLIGYPLIDFDYHLAVHLKLRHGVLPLMHQVRSLDPAVGMPQAIRLDWRFVAGMILSL